MDWEELRINFLFQNGTQPEYCAIWISYVEVLSNQADFLKPEPPYKGKRYHQRQRTLERLEQTWTLKVAAKILPLCPKKVGQKTTDNPSNREILKPKNNLIMEILIKRLSLLPTWTASALRIYYIKYISSNNSKMKIDDAIAIFKEILN